MTLLISKKWWQFWLPRHIEAVEEGSASGPAPRSKANKHTTVSARGRVVQTTQTEWTPTTASGGKVVKLMPKQLKEMKKAQEKPDVVQSLPE